jgi:hypothetical protein
MVGVSYLESIPLSDLRCPAAESPKAKDLDLNLATIPLLEIISKKNTFCWRTSFCLGPQQKVVVNATHNDVQVANCGPSRLPIAPNWLQFHSLGIAFESFELEYDDVPSGVQQIFTFHS